MDKRTLGKTDIKVSPIGLGVMQFSGGGGIMGKMFPIIPQETKNEIISTAYKGGIIHFDTAEIYGNGVSEVSLRNALKANNIKDEDVVVATKWRPILRTARNIKKSISTRIENLQGYTISLFMVHMPYSFSGVNAEMTAMADLVESDKIKSVGR